MQDEAYSALEAAATIGILEARSHAQDEVIGQLQQRIHELEQQLEAFRQHQAYANQLNLLYQSGAAQMAAQNIHQSLHTQNAMQQTYCAQLNAPQREFQHSSCTPSRGSPLTGTGKTGHPLLDWIQWPWRGLTTKVD